MFKTLTIKAWQNRKDKNRYFWAVFYPENMIDDWQSQIPDILQLPFSYCIHDKDHLAHSKESAKTHGHIIIAFPNTTTAKHAAELLDLLSKEGEEAFPLRHIQCCSSVRYCYDYLIHNTETCKKKGKYLYPPDSRFCGNNFDIARYEQISQEEKDKMAMDLTWEIINGSFSGYKEFASFVLSSPKYSTDINYFNVLRGNSGHFKNMLFKR